ncbi:Ig-like domain (group 3) [Bryocella elongata]|uniref:Ig-like domain (Group 3) n=2 Tax=Bryocella elongata TaxID=863522 RepID=A0A1H5UF91_9BACT|nr:Ig-like domain (group 3) [Bryocella elongata]
MRNLSGWKKSCLLAVGVAAGAVAMRAQTFVVPAAVTSYRTMPYTNLSGAQALATDPAGDLFFTRPGSGILAERPAGGGAEITLYTAPSGGGGYPKGVAANSTYAYMTDYAGHLWQVAINGGAATDLAPACNSLDGYYLGTQDVAADGLGNVYVAGNNETPLFKITSAGVCSTVTGVTLDANSHVAADAAGDLAYSTGGVLYSLPAGATSATAVSATFSPIAGLRADAAGDVFVTTGSSVVEVPYINGALSGANAFTVLNQSSVNDIAVGADGTLYATDGTNVFKNTIGNVRFAAVAVGSTSATQTVNVVFNAATTLTGFRYASGVGVSTEVANAGTGSCAATGTYAPGASCTIDLTFTPSTPGMRKDAVVLLTAAGLAGEVAVTGQGSGAALTVDPGTQIALGSGWATPAGVAVDPAGNVFATDSAKGTVSYLPAGATTATVIASGLSLPGAVAVGPDGSVYVASLGTNTIFEIPFDGTTFGTLTAVVTGLNSPSSLQFGAGGSLFVANTGAGTVLRIPNQSGTLNFTSRMTVAALTAPAGLAFDASGTLYVSDSAAGTISTVSGGVATTAVSGLSTPGTIAVDDAGSLYVVQNSGTSVTRIAYSGGSYNTNATTSLGSGFSKLVSAALDSAGNLYVADANGPSVTEIERTAGLLNLGKSNVGAATSAQSLIFSNGGDTSLTFGSPLYSAGGNTSDFTISTTATNTCANGASIASGTSCAVAASFDPTAQGVRTETLTISSNAVNASPVTGAFTGTGINLPKTTTALTITPGGTTTYGTSVTANVVVTSQGSTTTPTGTVTFLVNGVTYTTVALTNGQASATITGLPAGNDTIDATYSGDANYAASAGQTATIVVVLAPTTTTLTSSATSAVSVPPGTSITLTAKVTSAVTSSQPTGTVNFVSGGTVLAAASVNNSGIATVTTTTLPAGTYTITAVYSGDSGFGGSTSNGVQVALISQQYVVSSTPASMTVSAPGSASTTFTIAPISGYIGGVDFACSGLPANTQCAFIPATVQFTGTNLAPQTVTLTITTDTPAPSTVAWVLPFGSLLLLGAQRRRKWLSIRNSMLTALVVVASCSALLGLSGCGSSVANQTPGGTSTVTVTMTGTPNGTTTVPTSGAGNIVKTFTFSLTVK